MACNFCSTIVELTKKESGPFRGGYYPNLNVTQIVKGPEGNYHMWGDGGGDVFLSEIALENISYCPMCGRKLKE